VTVYTLLADINDDRFQNPQEIGTIWGEIQEEIEQLGGEIKHSYILLGDYDFQIIFDADHENAVLQIAMAVQRHGMQTKTMRSVPIDRLGNLADDI
jgi:uncharacterized protein with GYD domain